MPEEIPSFSVSPIPPLPKKKPVKRAIKKRAPTLHKKPATASPKDEPVLENIDEKINNLKIEKKLTEIYKDENGQLPDMQQIKIKKSSTFLRGIFTTVIVGGILAAVAWAGFFLLPTSQNKFSDQDISLTLTGPENITVGATTTYNLVIINKQRVDLKNTVLTLRYPEGFVFSTSTASPRNQGKNEWDIGDWPAGIKKEFSITGLSYGTLGNEQSWRVFLNYQPTNFQSEMQKTATLITKINRSPYAINLSGPDRTAAGINTTYTVEIKNENNIWPKQLIVSPTWPTNFSLTTSSLIYDKTNRWIINTSTSTTSTTNLYKFTFVGKFLDSTTTTLNAVQVSLLLPVEAAANIYEIGSTTITTEIAQTAVSANLAINGATEKLSTKPGEMLNISLVIKNNGKTDLTKGKASISLEGPSYNKLSVLDWANNQEKYNGEIKGEQLSDTLRRGTISWTAKNWPDLTKLKAGKEITVEWQIPMKDAQKIAGYNFGDAPIKATATVEFTDNTGAVQTASSNLITATINSDLSIDIRDVVSDNSDNKEVHNISWVLNNTIHPLKNVLLTAEIYGDVTWEKIEEAPLGTTKFDTKNKTITWQITDWPESVDVAAWPFKVTLNKKNPTQNMLESKVRVQAEDAVTGEKLDLLGDEIMLLQ